MKTTNKNVLETLESLRAEGTTDSGKELIFNPDTGEFVAKRPGVEPSPNSVTVGKIARDGFA